ncbi:MAG: 50S ribosomal protein L6 [Caldisericota bacterium]|nr:50S ribosomal protein L6 [Caldisericota bacterium]
MSRIGKKPIIIPKEVKTTIDEDNFVTIKGPKGELKRSFHPEIKIILEKDIVTVERPSERPFYRALHGTTRALINNMVIGVTNGYSKQLQLNEKTYKGEVQGKKVTFNLGFSHPIILDIPEDIDVVIEKRVITVSGINKESVGAFAQKIRHLRKVDPYKAKGIIYVGEKIIRKAGKAIAAGAK